MALQRVLGPAPQNSWDSFIRAGERGTRPPWNGRHLPQVCPSPFQL